MDHSSLTWFWKFKEPEGQLARWLERLQEYDFTVLHRPGKGHSNADGLSRLPCHQCGRETHLQTSFAKEAASLVLTISCAEVNLHEVSLRDLQLADSCRCGTHPQREGQWSETTTFGSL